MSIDIIMPPLSQTMDSMLLLEWTKKVGDTVKKGETLFTVETDKASLEVESPANGTLYEIYAQPNTEVKVRSVIGKILEPGESAPHSSEKITQSTIAMVESKIKTQMEPTRSQNTQKLSTSNKVFASPRARRLAEQNKVNLALLRPSGPRNMIVEHDVQTYLEEKLSISHAAILEEAQAMDISNIRKIIAQRMMSSHQSTAPVTYMSEADATHLVALRESVVKGLEPEHIKPTYTDFLIKILCLALKNHPDLNAIFDGEKLTRNSSVHMAIAVDTERGLIVPVLRDAQQYGIRSLAVKRQNLVDRAVKNLSTPDELTGGTFTISNLGIFGIDHFTPIINPPQVAILAVGRIREEPAVVNGQICIRQKIGLAITCDHRIVDGAPAARFLKDICDYIENPDLLWLDEIIGK